MQSILVLRTEQKDIVDAVRTTMKAEDHAPIPSVVKAREAVDTDPEQATLFLVSVQGDWILIATYGEEFPLGLASAIAEKAGANGFFVEAGKRNHALVWKITNGQHSDEAQDVTTAKAEVLLKDAKVPDGVLTFYVKEHLAKESIKHGNHQDVLLGFVSTAKKQGEVARALQEPDKKEDKSMSLDTFLEQAVGHERVRAIAKAQIVEQLKRDGFMEELTITNPQAEGHYCEAFHAESYSFTSNGPYVWFDWYCEEACEPRLPEEHAFPACDLRFSLQKSSDL